MRLGLALAQSLSAADPWKPVVGPTWRDRGNQCLRHTCVASLHVEAVPAPYTCTMRVALVVMLLLACGCHCFSSDIDTIIEVLNTLR